MIKLTTINILGQPNGILELKIKYDKTFTNIPTVRERLQRTVWKCKKFAKDIRLCFF